MAQSKAKGRPQASEQGLVQRRAGEGRLVSDHLGQGDGRDVRNAGPWVSADRSGGSRAYSLRAEQRPIGKVDSGSTWLLRHLGRSLPLPGHGGTSLFPLPLPSLDQHRLAWLWPCSPALRQLGHLYPGRGDERAAPPSYPTAELARPWHCQDNRSRQNEDPGWGQGACQPAPGLLTWQADLNDSPGSYY